MKLRVPFAFEVAISASNLHQIAQQNHIQSRAFTMLIRLSACCSFRIPFTFTYSLQKDSTFDNKFQGDRCICVHWNFKLDSFWSANAKGIFNCVGGIVRERAKRQHVKWTENAGRNYVRNLLLLFGVFFSLIVSKKANHRICRALFRNH